MNKPTIKRIVDCAHLHNALGFWTLEAVARSVGMDEVADECRAVSSKLMEIDGKKIDLERERQNLLDGNAHLRPTLLAFLEMLKDGQGTK
ncbi:MAG: hypothetical protein RIT24_1821 [Planctomycetota bacterium]|jgi:hypothetical protein